MITLIEIPDNEYEDLYSHMKRDFSGELAPFFAIKKNLDQSIYYGCYIVNGETRLGYALITAPEGSIYALLNYFAIFPEYRSKGYGGEALKILLDAYPGRTLVVEVDDPAAQKIPTRYEEAVRRIKFYERVGFCVMPTAKARIFGVDMLIMASAHDESFSPRAVMRALYLPALGSRQWLRFVDVRDCDI